MENFDFDFIDVTDKYLDDIDILVKQKYKIEPFLSNAKDYAQQFINQQEVGCISTVNETPILVCSAISLKLSSYSTFLPYLLKFFPTSPRIFKTKSILLLESLRAFNLPMQAVLAGYNCLFEDLKWVQSKDYTSDLNKQFFNCDYFWFLSSCKNDGKKYEIESLKQIEIADIIQISTIQKLFKKGGFDENEGVISLLVEKEKLIQLIEKLNQ